MNIAPSSRNQRGSIIPIVAAAIVALLGAVGLAIDLSRQQLIARNVQAAADAAALAAVDQFNTQAEGWTNAKRAALIALKDQRVHMLGTPFSDITLDRRPVDALEEDTSVYRFGRTDTDQFSVSIRRGTYWHNGTDFVFHPIEEAPERSYRKTKTSSVSYPSRYGLPVFFVANAVEIQLTVRNVPTMFANVLGFSRLGAVSRKAIAVFDDVLEANNVFPAAIPACRLLMDTNIAHGAAYQTESLDLVAQCSREVIAAEADPLGETALDNYLFDGRARFEKFIKPPTEPPTGVPNQCSDGTQRTPNCKASVPIYAVLGYAADVTDDPVPPAADPSEIKEKLKNLTTQNGVRLGQRFLPLEDALSPGKGLLSRYGEEIAIDLRAKLLVNDPSDTAVSDLFSPGARNYPSVVRETTNVTWPPGGPFQQLSIPNPGTVEADGETVNPWTITNPLCHDSQVSTDPDLAGAKSVTLMVIAPSEQLDTGVEVPYCDFESMFSNRDQRSVPPTADTKPIVVGFVEARLFDFRLTPYAPGARVTLPEGMTGEPLRERIAPDYFENFSNDLSALAEEVASKVSDFKAAFNDFSAKYNRCKQCLRDHETYPDPRAECRSECPRNTPPTKPTVTRPIGVNFDIPGGLGACFVLPDLDLALAQIQECRDNPIVEDPSTFVDDDTVFPPIRVYSLMENPVCGTLRQAARTWGYAKPVPGEEGQYTACVPWKNPTAPCDEDGCTADRFHFGNTRVSYGCGGLRMRLVCRRGRSFLTPTLTARARPSLVR